MRIRPKRNKRVHHQHAESLRETEEKKRPNSNLKRKRKKKKEKQGKETSIKEREKERKRKEEQSNTWPVRIRIANPSHVNSGPKSRILGLLRDPALIYDK